MSRKLPETISEDECIRIIKITKKEHHKLAFSLGFYEGLRVSEVTRLEPENIDFDMRLIRIKAGKGDKDRNIPIMPEIMGQLRKNRGLLPLSVKVGVRGIQQAFKRKVKLSGLTKDLHFHSLRHSCATWLLNEKKWDSRQGQQFFGHSSLNTTQIYTHVSPQNLLDLAWGKI